MFVPQYFMLVKKKPIESTNEISLPEKPNLGKIIYLGSDQSKAIEVFKSIDPAKFNIEKGLIMFSKIANQKNWEDTCRKYNVPVHMIKDSFYFAKEKATQVPFKDKRMMVGPQNTPAKISNPRIQKMINSRH